MNKKILIVEDELHIREALRINFIKNGIDVLLSSDGREALEIWDKNNVDLIILDVMLPYIDGLSVLSEVRNKDANIPIIILSAKDQVEDRIEGLARRADDYLGKPFHFEELLLRCRRLLDKKQEGSHNGPETSRLQFGSWVLSSNSLKAENLLTSKFIDLTDREFKLVQFLWDKRNSFVTRSELLENVWEVDPKTKTRTVDIFISRMRKYFEEDPSDPKYFISKRIRGYQIKV